MEDQENIDIEQFHRNEVIRGIPLILFLIGICLTGSIGNTLVYLVYKDKYPSSNCRTFVMALSIVDLLTSMFGIPFEILYLFLEYNMPVWMCKTSLFVNTLPTLTSAFVLIAIAIDRYRKVCKPFSWQISNSAAKWMCLFTVVISLALSWLQPIIHGLQTRKHAKYNITISECVETDDMKKTVFTWLNTFCAISWFVGSLAGLLFMYCSIAFKIKRHNNRQMSIRSNSYKSNEAKPEDKGSQSVKLDTVNDAIKSTLDKEGAHRFCCYSRSVCDGIKHSTEQSEELDANRTIESDMDAEIKHEKHAGKKRSVLSRLHSLRSSFSSTDTHPTASRSNSVTQNISIKIKNFRHRNTFRTAYIMFLISLAFVISYLPTLCLHIISTADDTFVIGLKDGSETAYKFFLRSFLLNCACNPVIYGLCDKRFRKHCKTFISKWEKCRCQTDL